MSTSRATSSFTLPPSPGVGRLALALIPGGLLALLSITVVGVALPSVGAELDSGLARTQWVTSGYLLAAGVAIALSAWASRRFGVRRTWLTAVALFAGGSFIASVAPTVDVLIAARMLQGFGGGMLEPVMLTALAQAAGPARMGRVMGSAAAVMSVGPLAGPALGGVITDALTWRWIFGAPAILAVVVLVASAVLLRESGERHDDPLDALGLALIGIASLSALYGLSRAAEPHGIDLTTGLAIAVAFASLAAFTIRARPRGDRSIIDLTTFATRGFSPAVTIMALLGVAIYPLFFGLPLYYQGVVGLSAAEAGLMMIPYGVGNLIVMPLAGFLSDRIGGRRIICTGAGIAGAGFALLMLTGAGTPIVLFVVVNTVIGCGIGAIASPAVASMYRVLPPSLIPSGSTALFLVNQIGGALGVALLTSLTDGSTWDHVSGSRPLLVPVIAAAFIMVSAVRVPLSTTGGRRRHRYLSRRLNRPAP